LKIMAMAAPSGILRACDIAIHTAFIGGGNPGCNLDPGGVTNYSAVVIRRWRSAIPVQNVTIPVRKRRHMARPAVILVGADKGGVGKTTVARTLLDYFTAHQMRCAPSTPKIRAARSNASIPI
jgi:hypothetical protein